MLSNRRLISLALTVCMLISCIPSAFAEDSGVSVVFSEGFNSSPTGGSAPSNISVEGGSDIAVTDIAADNKALKIELNDASAKFSFSSTVSKGTIWYGVRFKLNDNVESGSMFQITDASGSKLNLINIKERSASIYDGKVFDKFLKQLWTDLHVKLNYDKKTMSVYVDGKCVLSDWKITRAIPAASRIGFEFSNAGRNSSIEIDHIVSYTGSKVMKSYPAQQFSTEVAEGLDDSSAAKISRLYLYEDFNATGFNAASLTRTAFNHIIAVRNLQGRTYAEETDRMYCHMERLSSEANFPHFEVPMKDFDATNYVIDMTLNIFELSGIGFELTLKKGGTTKAKLMTAEQNGILKCGGSVFNQFDLGKWNRLSLVVNALASTFDVYINGDLVKEGCSVSGDLKDINQIGFQLVYGSGSGSMGLDEIAVYEGSELKPGFGLENFTQHFINMYDKIDTNVASFIGDKAVFCLNNSAFYKDGTKTKYEDKGYENFAGVPMGSASAMAAAYGVAYNYDASSKTVTLGNGASFKVGDDSYTVNGKTISADSIIEEKDGVVFAPAKSFFEKLLGKTVSYNSDWLLLFISDDGSYVSTENAAMMQDVMYLMIFDRPSGDDMSKIISERFPSGEHPRALFTKADISRVQKLLETDEYAQKLYTYLELNANSILDTKPVGFSATDDGAVDAARTREDRMTDLGIMYHLTGDERYAKRGIEELEEMVKMPYLGWGKALSSGAIMAAFTRGYDLFYDVLSPELRTKIEDCVISLWERDLLDGSNATGNRNFNYMHATANWNPVHNGPYLESTFVFADNPRMAEYAKKQFAISLRNLECSMVPLAPDGACPEGAGYWMYTMLEWAPAVKSLINCLGTTLGFEDHIGMEKSCYFMIDIQGNAKTNAFHDTGKGSAHSSRKSIIEQGRAMFLLSDIYQDAGLLNSWLSNIDNFLAPYNGTSLMWYNPELMKTVVSSPLDNRYRGDLDFVALRASHADENSLFLGAHSGQNYMSHSHIDGGTYVLDAMGLNWVSDIGTEDYASDYDPRQGKYYSTRPEAHNVYLINPRAGYQGQDVYASGATIEFESTDRGGYAIVDMSKYYEADVVTAQRGFKLANNRSHVIVRDEMNLKGASDVISFIHTQADIEIIDNNRAILEQFGKKMLVEVTTNGNNLTLEKMECEMLPTSPAPQPDARDYSEYHKLAIKLSAFGNLTITVKYTPLYDERITSTEIDETPLALWEPEEGEFDAPRLSAVYADGVQVDGFDPVNSVVRVPVGAGVSKAPVITAACDERYNAEILQNRDEMLSDVIIKLTDKTNPKNISYYTVRLDPEVTPLESLDGINLAAISSIISEDTGDNLTEVLTDRNFATEKYESKGGKEYMIDLGAVRNIDSVITAFAAHSVPYKYIYDIQVSEDGNKFISKSGIWSHGAGSYEAVKLGENVKARYIRIIANGRTAGHVSRLCEVAVAVK